MAYQRDSAARMGARDELVISRMLKRLMVFELSYGNIDCHRSRYAAMVTPH